MTADGVWEMTWAENATLAKMADGAGLEVLLPVGRWKGYGGKTNFNNSTFESLTWASAIAAITNYSTIFSTVHAPLIHPVAAAKLGATIDHVFGGRFALNIVAGWFKMNLICSMSSWLRMTGVTIMRRNGSYWCSGYGPNTRPSILMVNSFKAKVSRASRSPFSHPAPHNECR